jgi:hypothetical protein
MTDSGIPALQEMALDHALSSDDIATQLAALRVLLTNTKALTFQLKLSDDNSERTRQSVASHGGGFSIQIDDWDTETASFSKAGDTYVGALSGCSLCLKKLAGLCEENCGVRVLRSRSMLAWLYGRVTSFETMRDVPPD